MASLTKIKKIAVIGASGYIGSSLCIYFSRIGFSVVAISRKLNTRIAGLKNISLRLVESYAHSSLVDLLRGCDCVFHCAGSAHVSNSFILPPQPVDITSVAALESVVDASILAGVDKFIYFSSVAVYGSHSISAPFSEDMLLAPRTKYAVTKIVSERALISRLSASGVQWFIFRLPLVFSGSAPGNLLFLTKYFNWSPFNIFLCLTKSRSIISMDNLLAAMDFVIVSSSFACGVYNISDPVCVSVSSLAQRVMNSSRFYIGVPVPLFMFELLLGLLGRYELRAKLCCEFEVDCSSFIAAKSAASPSVF